MLRRLFACSLLILFGAGTAVADGGAQDHIDRLVIKKSERKMLIMEGDEVTAEMDVALGLMPKGHKEREGDFRTPEGEYFLGRRNPDSQYFLSIEVTYPNTLDRISAERRGVDPGGEIMIHGQPNRPKKKRSYYENFDWTDGCIAVSNADMVRLWLRTSERTRVSILP